MRNTDTKETQQGVPRKRKRFSQEEHCRISAERGIARVFQQDLCRQSKRLSQQESNRISAEKRKMSPNNNPTGLLQKEFHNSNTTEFLQKQETGLPIGFLHTERGKGVSK